MATSTYSYRGFMTRIRANVEVFLRIASPIFSRRLTGTLGSKRLPDFNLVKSGITVTITKTWGNLQVAAIFVCRKRHAVGNAFYLVDVWKGLEHDFFEIVAHQGSSLMF